MPKKTNSGSFYASNEAKKMAAFKRKKDALVRPLIKIFVRLGVTPNMISYLGLIAAFGFLIFAEHAKIALILLCTHLIFDGLDGPLARYTKKISEKGAFTDAGCDLAGFLFITVGLTKIGLLNEILTTFLIFLYTLTVFFIVIKRHLKTKIPAWIPRPRLYIFGAYFIYVFTNLNLINGVALIAVAVMVIDNVWSFVRVRGKL